MRWLRAALALVLASGALGLDSAPARADNGPDGLTRSFGECAQQRGAADVLMLFDQSLSLEDTDADMVRRAAGRDLVGQLTRYAGAAGVDARIQVAGFDGEFMPGTWRDLEPESLEPTLRELERVADNEGLGPATDYWMALDGARKQLSDARAQRPSCQLLIWFSDGAYDVDEAGSFGTELPYAPGVTLDAQSKDRVIAAGKESICSPKQGPVNALRASDAYVAAVGLSVEDADLGFMRGAADGSGGCGGAPEPDHGVYLEAEQAGQLALSLAQLSGGQLSEGEYDQRVAQLDFGLDEAVSQASVLAYAGPASEGNEMDFGLSGPDQAVTWWTDGDPEVGSTSGASVRYEEVTDHAARFTIDRGPDTAGWKGRWTVHIRSRQAIPDKAKAQMVVTVTGDLRPEWVQPVDQATAGSEIPVAVRLMTASDEEFTADHPGIRIGIDYVDSNGESTSLASGLTASEARDGRTVRLPETPGAGRLSLRLDLTTDTIPPTEVAPSVSPYPLRLTVPATYPGIAADELRFPPVAGAGPSTAMLRVTGPGCVWFDAGRSQDSIESLPDGVATASLDVPAPSEDACVRLAEGESQDLEIALTPSAEGNGTIIGSLSVWGSPDGEGEDLEVTVPFVAERSKVADAQVKWLTFIALLVLGLALGAVPLMVARASLARIRVRDPLTGPLQVARRSFSFRDGSVVDPSGALFSLGPGDVSPASSSPDDAVRRLDLGEVSIEARVIGNPFAVPDCAVRRAAGPVATSGTGTRGRASLPLALPGQWVAWPEGDGIYRCLFFLGGNEALESQLPGIASDLADRLRSAETVIRTGSASSGGPGSGAPEPAQAPPAQATADGASWAGPTSWGAPAGDDWSGPASPGWGGDDSRPQGGGPPSW